MLHIVQFEPESGHNTANIARTCLATNAALHLINHKFVITEKTLERVSAGHWFDTEIHEYASLEEFFEKNNVENFYLLTRFGTKQFEDMDLNINDKDVYIILGSETSGLPTEFRDVNIDKGFRIPMADHDKVPCLNVSNVAAIVAYEAMRQSEYKNLK